MFFLTGTSRSNDRDGQSVGQFGQCLIGIAFLHPVVVHAGEQDFSRTPAVGFFRPFHQEPVGFQSSSVEVTFPALRSLSGIDGHHAYLRTEVKGNVVDELRVAEGRGVDRHLVRPGVQKPFHVAQFVDAATHRERNIDFRRDAFH